MEGKFDSKAPDRPHPRSIYIPNHKKEEKRREGETERRIKVDFEGEKQRSQCEMLQKKRGRVAY